MSTTTYPARLGVGRWERVSANGIEPNAFSPPDQEDPSPEQIEVCRRWLRGHAVRTARYGTWTSYALKRLVIQWTRTLPRGEVYVNNGSLIAAALLEGFRVRRVCVGHINVLLALDVVNPGSEAS